jgi:hypothetical protein
MIVRLQGGLGNQMFQYAFGKSLSCLRKEEVYFSLPRQDRPYGLDAFSTEVRFVDETNVLINESGFQYDPKVLSAPVGATYIGFWQTERYFNEALVRKSFVLRNKPGDKSQEIADNITQAEVSAFLHVRRGDYTTPNTNAYHGMPVVSYYMEAIRRIQEKHEEAKFFVFSDEPNWCRTAFPKEFTIVDHNANSPHEDIWLMSQCKHGIIANSSFSWWGAWLGDTQPSRLIFAPERWFNVPLDTSDLLPGRWIRLQCTRGNRDG